MSVKPDVVADAIFGTLKGYGFQLKIYDGQGNVALDPSIGRRFFAVPENIFVSLQSGESGDVVNLYLSENTDKDKINNLIQQLRAVATHNNYEFNIRVYNKKLEPKDFAFVGENTEIRGISMDNKVEESKNPMIGSMKSSYQNWNSARLIVRHTKPIAEEIVGARSRNIQKIFIETKEGERFKFPVIHLTGARAMAKHIGAGGSFGDKVGQHIVGLSEEFKDLQKINRHIFQNLKSLNESVADIRENIRVRVNEIRQELNKFMTISGYTAKVIEVEKQDIAPLNEENLSEQINMLRSILMIAEDDSSFNTALSRVASNLDEKKAKMPAVEVDPALVEMLKKAYGEGEVSEAEFVDAARLVANPEQLEFLPKSKRSEAKKAEYRGKMSPMQFLAWRLAAISERMKPVTDGAFVLSAILSRIAAKIEMALDSGGPNATVKVNPAEKQITQLFLQKVAPTINEARPLGHPEGYWDPELVRAKLQKDAVNNKPSTNVIDTDRLEYQSIRKVDPDTSILKPEFRRKKIHAVMPEMRELDEWFENFNPLKMLKESAKQKANEKAEESRQKKDKKGCAEAKISESKLSSDDAWWLADSLIRGNATANEILEGYNDSDRALIAKTLRENWTSETTESIIKDLSVNEVESEELLKKKEK